MLEVIGGILLFLFLFFLGGVWLAWQVIRALMNRARAAAAMVTGGGHSGQRRAPVDPRWRELARHLDRRQVETARLAEARIAALLAERNSSALTPEESQLLISCERRVPEMLDACLERCATARPDERCHYADQTLERLVLIGEEAERTRSAIRARDDGRLTTMHRYFDTVAERH